MNIYVLCALFIPIVFGALILLLPVGKTPEGEKKVAYISLFAILLDIIVVFMALNAFAHGAKLEMTLLYLTERLPLYFSLDKLGAFFTAFIPVIWLLAGIFSLEYLHHENHKRRFWGFYLLTLGSLEGLCFAGNLATMYLFFEMMTLASMPLALHTQTHEAIMGGLKYLLYSMAGAYCALFGIFVMYHFADDLNFNAGGVLDLSVVSENPGMIHLAVFCMILGFGVKAGMFPMHAWLPTAHPVAPAPASAVLSGIIVKGGILAVIRSVFYIAGPESIRGTWVQNTWIVLSMFTVFMGSMLAYNEKVLKKRLAYSSVSQLSYILLGLAVLNPVAMTGSLLHVLFHAVIKTALFLTAGAIIYQTGHTKVTELRGIGKEMPITIWAYTFVSLGLIGIPPMSGFVSKWYLATGMLNSGLGAASWLGPVVLLVSALLTAGYLLPITINGFLPGNDYDYKSLVVREPSWKMTVPLVILAAVTMLIGMFPGSLIDYLGSITASLM